MRILKVLPALLVLPALAGCAARGPRPEPASGTQTAGAGEPWTRSAGAFALNARVQSGGESKRLALQAYLEAPDRFRIEVRGAVGGIAVVATGRAGAVRIVVPSRRRYAEASLADDIGSGLIGLPLTGCDLAMVLRISSGMSRFQPCGGEGDEPAPAGPPDRPGLIVDTSLSGQELLRFGWDWSAPGEFPREARIELAGSDAETVVALTGFRALRPLPGASEGLFWEPLPEGARRVAPGELASEDPP